MTEWEAGGLFGRAHEGLADEKGVRVVYDCVSSFQKP